MEKKSDTSIYLKDAELWCSNWRKTFQRAFPAIADLDILRGFHIPLADITALGLIHDSAAVRGYLAMEDPNDPSTLKMLLVPIVKDKNGYERDKIMDDMPISPTKYYIYDFTRPCPIQCDYGSPLFGSVASNDKMEGKD